MSLSINTYLPGDSFIHRADARVKVLLLLIYSVSLFFLNTWTGLFISVLFCLVFCLAAKISLLRILSLLMPLYVILAFTLLFNAFSFDINNNAQVSGLGNVSLGLVAGWQPVSLVGSFGFIPQGFIRGSFYVLRIIVLVLASLLISFTTVSTDLIDALHDFFKPLKRFRVPVEDVAMIISVAIRFIPLTAEELFRIRDAQRSRGATFDEGGLIRRMRAWQPVFIPLFVNLFRRASILALALDARCYGMLPERTRLRPRAFSLSSVCVVAVGFVVFFGLSLVF